MMTNLMLQGTDGRFYYLTPQIKEAPSWGPKVTWTADGQPIETYNMGNSNLPTMWLVTDHEVDAIVANWSGSPILTGWKLRDPGFAAEKTPAFVSVDPDSRALSEDVLDALYEAVYESAEAFERRFPASVWTRYDGEPAPADGLKWVAKLPYYLGERAEILHLFPGYLEGFRDAAIARLKAKRHMGYVFDKHSSLEVHAEIPYVEPTTKWEPKRLASGRKSSVRVQVERKHSVKVVLPIFDQIAGTNRAAAVARWNEEMAKLDAFAVELTTVRACGHCDGRGIVTGSAATS